MPIETLYTDEKILNALDECLKEAYVPSSKVAKKLGASQEYIKNRLKVIMGSEYSPIEGEIEGSSWAFRFKKE